MCDCAFNSESDEHRHGHWLKGNSPLNYVGPRISPVLFSVGSKFGAFWVCDRTITSDDVKAGVLNQLSKAMHLLWHQCLHNVLIFPPMQSSTAALFHLVWISVQLPFKALFSLVTAWFVHSFSSTSQKLAFSNCPFPLLPNAFLLWRGFWFFVLTVIQLGKISPQEEIQTYRHNGGSQKPDAHTTVWKNSSFIKEHLLPTCRIQSVKSRYSITVEHPEMAVVTGKQAGFTRGHNMIPHNIATRRGRERE